jgi:hypothetical protein
MASGWPKLVALLEHEGRHAQAPELAGLGNDLVRSLLEGVTNEDQRAYLEQFGLRACARYHPFGSRGFHSTVTFC